MSTTNPVSMQIDGKTVEAIINANLQAAVLAQFTANPNLIETIVKAAIKTKVDADGKVNTYDSYNRHSLVEVLSSHAIRDAAKVAIAQWVEENKPAILTAIKKQLNTSKVDLIKRFVDAAERSMAPEFRIECNLKLSTDR